MGKHEDYWNGLEQYHAEESFRRTQKDEFKEDLPMEDALSEESLGLQSNRRDFLKIFGFGLTAAALTACVEKPVRKAVPYVNKPENVTPGRAEWYASTCGGCSAACGVTVKSREGRPIKVEGNDLHKLSQGGTCPVGQATILNLYDSGRLKASRGKGGASMKWGAVDNEIMGTLEQMGGVGNIYLVSNTITSPSSHKVISAFKAKYPNTKHVSYDAVSNYALAKVHSDGSSMMQVPGYHFDKAKVIVSIDADFIGTWISPVEYTKDYVKGRKVSEQHPDMSKHIQFESRMSITGSNADLRVPMKPAQLLAAVAGLHEGLTGGSITFKGPGNAVDRAVRELKKAGQGNSLVVCGINDVNAQTVVKAINEYLGNYGSTIDMDHASYQVQGNDEAMMDMVGKISGSDVVIFLDDANPVYDFMKGEAVKAAIGKAKASIAFVSKENETSQACTYALAQTHWLEAWNDAMPRKGHYSIQQPLVRPLWDSRSWQDALLTWSGSNVKYYDFIKKSWESDVFSMASGSLTFKDFWTNAVRNGFVAAAGADHHPAMHEDHDHDHGDAAAHENEEMEEVVAAPVSSTPNAGAARSALLSAYKANDGKVELVVYQSNNMRDGRWANNPWLLEMPDPITKVTWDNYISVPYVLAKSDGWKDGDKAKLSVNGQEITLPVIVQPGQAANTFAVQVGYGRTVAGKVAEGIGENAYKLLNSQNGTFNYNLGDVQIEATGENIAMAKTQTYIGYEMENEGGAGKRNQVENRISDYILKETTLGEYQGNRASGNKRPSGHHMLSLWNIHDKKGHHWAMAIDMNSCTGCGTCIVSCNVENNIATVGREEVVNRREMHWMRIDRYFKGDPADQEGNLHVAHQPMLCQHCDNAPCETVCPVLATVHSDEGLNQQVYNRCIGTRYCANNCPYKVRRFNWFSYYWNDDFKDVNAQQRDAVGRLVLNPDVTVRARGVMEKCSFCVQRIQEKKLGAKVENRKLKDGEIKTACQQSCPADAIVFGDLNDTSSEIYKLYHNKRGYHALEDVKTLPSVLYLTKVRNTESTVAASEPAHDGGTHS